MIRGVVKNREMAPAGTLIKVKTGTILRSVPSTAVDDPRCPNCWGREVGSSNCGLLPLCFVLYPTKQAVYYVLVNWLL